MLFGRELLPWLRVARTVGIGCATLADLISVYGSIESVISYLEKSVRENVRLTRRIVKVCSEKEAMHEIETVYELGGQIIPINSDMYPKLLKLIPSAPVVLTVLGSDEVLISRCISVIGSRDSSLNGIKFANDLSCSICAAGYTVVSGLAVGIDSAANGVTYSGYRTIAVLASGVDLCYPGRNRDLYDAIVASGIGALISEFPVGTHPSKQSFPQRNRVIAGISYGVVVIEASLRSGAMITARYAMNYGRDLFVVPGAPFDHRASGCNKLLKDGAKLVEKAEDILEALDFSMYDAQIDIRNQYFSDAKKELYSGVNLVDEKIKNSILQALDYVGTDVEALVNGIGCEVNVLLAALLELELEGRVVRCSQNGNLFFLASTQN